MANVCVTHHEGNIKSNVHFSYMHNMRNRKCPSFIHDLVNHGILSDKDIGKDGRQNTRHDR